jgi:hypothetical protein
VSNRLEELARRKQALIERCAQERAELAAVSSQIRSPLHLGAVILGVTKLLKTYPLVAAGISSLLVSGYGSKFTRSAATLTQLGRLVLPVLSWISKRRKGK